MRAVERACLAGEKALVEVVRRPEVEVADLRPLDRNDAEERASRNLEAPRIARRHDHLVHLLPALPCGAVGREVVRHQAVHGIAVITD